MFCKQCRYPLSQLRAPSCPECGLSFDRNDARTFARYAKRRRLSVKSWLVLALCVYFAGYGVARWRKLIVRDVHTTGFKTGAWVTTVRAGEDMRDHGVGAIKNAVAEPVAWVYTPLRRLEAAFWNWREDRNEP